MSSFSQTQQQSHLMRLSPQQLQVLGLLQLNALELAQKIKDELIENPVLEEVEDGETESIETAIGDFDTDMDTDTEGRVESDDLSDYERESYYQEAPITHFQIEQATTFRENLKERLDFIQAEPEKIELAKYLVDNLDDDGYLRTPLADIADYMSFRQNIYVEEEELKEALLLVQQLEPLGVGARDLRECLLIQLDEAKACPASTLAFKIVDEYFDLLSHRHFEKLRNKLNVEEAEFQDAIHAIGKLRPKPVTEDVSVGNAKSTIIPEFIIQKDGDDLIVSLNGKQFQTELRINNTMVTMVEKLEKDRKNKSNRAVAQYLRSKVNAAQNLVEAIRQRENSMYETIKAIVAIQNEYFKTGDIRLLKPMILKNVADRCQLDPSTISRVTSTKYAQTDFGLIKLKDLFSQSTTNDEGNEISTKVVQDIIADLIANEDKLHPASDQELTDALEKLGFNIARRTVAKYRERMNIPMLKLRRSM